MSFKTKNKVKKKEDFDNRVTLDAKHTEKINEFQLNMSMNQKKKKQLKRLEKKLKRISTENGYWSVYLLPGSGLNHNLTK